MKPSTYTFRVDGMHCASCSMLIDDTVQDLPGVVTSTTSYKQQLTAVHIAIGGATPDEVAAAIADLGYRAQRTD